MYLLTEWECRTGKYLARGQDPYFLTDGQIFSRPFRPDSVNKHFIIRLWCFFLIFPTKQTRIDPCAFLTRPHAFSRPHHLTHTALMGNFFFIWFSNEIARGAVPVIVIKINISRKIDLYLVHVIAINFSISVIPGTNA